jgi:predicted methyltransferase
MIRQKRIIAVTWLCAGFLLGVLPANAADEYDAAVMQAGRPADDSKRDALDHPAQMLRLAGIKAGMKVADVLAGNGYYSELLSYVVGPKGQVLMINNLAFDNWSQPALQNRLAGKRFTNVTHETVDLNDMKLAPASLDAVLLVKVYHDMYWVDSTPKSPWPKIDVSGVLDQLSKALKPGGVLLLIDHSAKLAMENPTRASCIELKKPSRSKISLRTDLKLSPRAICCEDRTMRGNSSVTRAPRSAKRTASSWCFRKSDVAAARLHWARAARRAPSNDGVQPARHGRGIHGA